MNLVAFMHDPQLGEIRIAGRILTTTSDILRINLQDSRHEAADTGARAAIWFYLTISTQQRIDCSRQVFDLHGSPVVVEILGDKSSVTALGLMFAAEQATAIYQLRIDILLDFSVSDEVHELTQTVQQHLLTFENHTSKRERDPAHSFQLISVDYGVLVRSNAVGPVIS